MRKTRKTQKLVANSLKSLSRKAEKGLVVQSSIKAGMPSVSVSR